MKARAKRIELGQKILVALTDKWQSLVQIRKSIGDEYSVGLISSILMEPKDGINDKIEWDTFKFGPKDWQERQLYKLKSIE